MSERQNAFTIKTNRLSDEVYNRLATYAKSRKLGEYISSLILRDLDDSSTGRKAIEDKKTYEMLEHIKNELADLKTLAKTTGFVGNDSFKEEEPSKVPQLKEGKIADLENISGSLDDDDLEEYNDF
ncbi:MULTISPECIES: hypothetical protein [Priestia]|jgi:hypothetical protein|uniref:Conserved domain protein n=1 Tax=Priestia megaterium (strain ATCC 12872 / QMB1551) TaxID=545693 RepID=D5E3P9_PRIM1|nr:MULTISPECIES: hypothetical protein [Priestia]ADE72424.1 conserved domain protein [Priestia megaterium QM B1551]MBG9930614.1 hypothetical protein [Priestia aryabhattai]MBG9930679.1 hypothetical protein [Priestia aryabhattai]QSX24276.1 hypothetical protein J0P05_31720 [Priestia megaterium]WEZ61460.1 hypothetical protein P5632_27315 [Priestia megaterium]